MRAVHLSLSDEEPKVDRAQKLYGTFDLDFGTGKPSSEWEIRNIALVSVNLNSYWFPDFFHRSIQVNRRCAQALLGAYEILIARFDHQYRNSTGINDFVRCYCFGHGEPNLFWWGGAWELSPRLTNDNLKEMIKIFQSVGWTQAGTHVLEYWKER